MQRIFALESKLKAAMSTVKILAAVAGVTAATMQGAGAVEKITFMMSWRAQADQGGFFQAAAKNYYSECGVDVTIKQGGPGIDPAQLLAGGAIDFAVAPFIDTVLQLNQAGFPARAVMGIYQRSSQILMTHQGNGIEKLEDMRGSPIMIAAISRKTFWPFFRDKYGWSDSQIRAYTGQLTPFFADDKAVQQAFITNEPFLIKKQTGKAPKTFLLADFGYLTYGALVVTSQGMIDSKPEVVKCMVQAISKGWTDFLKDPAPGFGMIKAEEPKNTDDLMAYTHKMIIEQKLVQNEDTEKFGIGYMSDDRWTKHYEMLLSKKLFDPMNYKEMYTTRFLPKKSGP